LQLNPASPVPLYHQLADILLEQIHSGRIATGEKLPAEILLAAEYGIGRPTVRQAIDLLVRKGLVQRRRGSGTYVLGKKQQVDLFSLAGTTSAFHEQGIAVQSELLQPLELLNLSPESENPLAGSSVYLLKRRMLVDGIPVLLEYSYLHAGLFAGLERFDLQGRSLAQVAAEQYYLQAKRGRQTFRVVQADAGDAKLLGLQAGAPVLAVKRSLDFPSRSDGVYAELLYRTDRFVFTQTIGEPND